jgi:Fe-S cluster biogenesis protein NfuA
VKQGATTENGAPGDVEEADSSRDEHLREASQRLERLLEDIRGMAGPSTWTRVEELVRGILELHGAGLRRLLELAGTDRSEEPLRERVSRDELVSSLLLLHGLHPMPMAERIRVALDEMRPFLDGHSHGVELVDVQGDGVVRLRVFGSSPACPSSSAAVEHAIRRIVEEAAPEVTRIEIEGARAAPAPSGLVELKLRKPEHPR